jgi:hypothetical protein
MPQTDGFGTKCRVGQFKDNTADILIDKEITTGELEIVQGSFRVEEEWIAPPACEEATIAGVRYSRLSADRDRRQIEDNVPAVPIAHCVFSLNATYRRQLGTVAGGEKRTR